MTEYNLFCYSKNCDDNNSFQQKRFRAFNKEVGESRYYEIKDLVYDILTDFKLELDKKSWSEEWEKVTPEQWSALLNIPEAKDFKEGFEFITGIKIQTNDVIELTLEDIAALKGVDVSRIKIKE